jgi:hypothetical protein
VKLAIAILVVVCLAGSARADKKAAESYFRAGAKAYAAQNFLAAAQNFDEAYKAAPMPEIAFSAAQAYRRLFRIDAKPDYVKRSVELYKAYLSVVKKGGRVGDAADNLAEMEKELDRVKVITTNAPVVAKTRIGVSVTLADQRVESGALQEIGDATGEVTRGLVATIDGKPVEPFALVDVEPREHVIVVSADGYIPVEKKTVAVDGASQIVEIELQPKPAAVTVKTESGARISVDGRPHSGTQLQLAAGKHLLAIVHRGREPVAREITVSRGEALTVDAPLEKTAKRRAVPWVLGGAGLLAAGAITTSIVATVHDGRASDLRDAIDAGNRPASDGDRYDDEVRARDRYATATWILGGAAITAGTVGVLLYLFDTPSAEGVRVSPVIGPTSGISLGGSF